MLKNFVLAVSLGLFLFVAGCGDYWNESLSGWI